MCTLDSPSPNLESAWRDIERAVVAAKLDEWTTRAALDAICGAIREHLGVPSELSTDGAATTFTHRAVVHDGDDEVTVSWMGQRLDDATNRRLERLLASVGEHAARSVDLHRLRNQVAGIQTNIELARLLVDADPAATQREEILRALDHASTKCREMVAFVGATTAGSRRLPPRG